MEKYWLLTRVMNKGSEMDMPDRGGKAKAYKVLGIIALSLIMIPCCVFVGFMVFIMTEALQEANGNTEGIMLISQLMNIFAVTFSIMVIFNTLYFSSDLNHYLTYPVKPGTLVAAKFTNCYMGETVMEFLVLLSAFIGYFIAAGFSFVGVIGAILGIMLIPLLPFVYCGIFSLLVMAFCNKFKILRNVDFVVGFASLAFVGLFIVSFIQMDSINVDNYINSLVYGTNIFTVVMDKLFFTVPILLKGIAERNILYLLLFVLVNAISVAILFFLGDKLYLRGVYLVSSNSKEGGSRILARLLRRNQKSGNENEVADGSVSKKAVEELKDDQFELKSQSKALFMKEVRTLWRTPAYRKYCVNINFVWPFLVVALFVLPSTKNFMVSFEALFQVGYVITDLIVLLAIIMIAFFVTAMNSISATSFTREGEHFSFMKYAPIEYEKQIWIKALVSYIYSGITVLVTSIVFLAFMKTNLAYSVFFIVVGLLCVSICTSIGIMLDSTHPKLVWEDEYSALRGNLNAFFNMAISIIVAIVFCLIGYVFFRFTNIRTGPIFIMYFVIILVAEIRLRKISMLYAISSIKKM